MQGQVTPEETGRPGQQDRPHLGARAGQRRGGGQRRGVDELVQREVAGVHLGGVASVHGRKAQIAGRAAISSQLLTQASDGRRVEYCAHRKVGIQAGVDRGDHRHRQQRIPAQIEERLVDPDPLEPEYLGVDAGHDLLGLGLRRPEGCGGNHRRRQRLAVDLARGGQRELLEHHNVRRHHVIGQPRAQPLTHRADLGVGVGVVGVGGALVGPGGGQVEVGQRWGVLAVGFGGDEDGIEGAGLGAPGDGDVVSGGFAEAVQLFGGGGVGGRARWPGRVRRLAVARRPGPVRCGRR